MRSKNRILSVAPTAWLRAVVYPLAVLALAGACDKPRPKDVAFESLDIDHAALAPIPLERLWQADSSIMSEPLSIAADGDVVVVVDRTSPAGRVFLLDARSGQLRGAVGRVGNGPDEYQSPTLAINAPHGTNGFWLKDGSRNFLRIDVNAPGGPAIAERMTLAGTDFVERFAWLNDSILVANGNLDTGWVVLYRRDGSLVGQRGVVPGPKEDSTLFRNYAYHSWLAARPDGSEILLATVYAGEIVTLDANGRLRRRFQTPFEWPMHYSTQDSTGRVRFAYIRSQHRVGYSDIVASTNHVYGLFSGRMYLRGRRQRAGNYVHIFDWSGALRSVVSLDADVHRISIDPAENTLYAITNEPVVTIMAYRLPSVLATER